MVTEEEINARIQACVQALVMAEENKGAALLHTSRPASACRCHPMARLACSASSLDPFESATYTVRRCRRAYPFAAAATSGTTRYQLQQKAGTCWL